MSHLPSQQAQENGASALPGVLRSLAAAGGALAGGLLAVPIAGVLFVFLFERVGVSIVESVVSEAMEGVDGLEALFVGLFLALAAVVLAVVIVVALVAPVFVVLPMVAVAVALRLARAGLIMRTIGFTLATVLALAVGVVLVANVAGLKVQWWLCFPVLAAGGFAGRYLVERTRPDRAGVPDTAVVGRRWKRVAVAWLVVVLVGVAGGIAVVLSATAQVSGSP
ncbi:hypothetical protein [Flindersiella endophytica]